MQENDQREPNWTGKRLARKIDRSATSDAEDMIQLIVGMSRALAGIFTAPFRQRRLRQLQSKQDEEADQITSREDNPEQ